MSPKAAFAVGSLALSAVAFGIGHWIGTSQAPAPAPIIRAKLGVAPPSDAVGGGLYAVLIKPDPLERASELGRRLQALGPEALEAVREAYDAVLLDVGDVDLVLFAEWWARFDPAAAFGWARSSRIGWHPAVLFCVARAWAHQDPEAASRAIQQSVSDPRLLGATVVGLVRGWEESGRDGLDAYLARQPSAEVVQQALEAVARAKVLRDGSEAAIAWAEALPADEPPVELKWRAYRSVAAAIVQVDPERAATWVARQAGGPNEGSGLFSSVGTGWAQRDGAAAMRWLSTLPAGGRRNTAVAEAFRTWLAREPEAASQWMRAVQLEPWLEPAVAVFAPHLRKDDPEEALSWAYRVSEPSQRERAITLIALSWLESAPEEAQAWLDRAELSEKARDRIAQLQALRARYEAAEAGSPPAPEGAEVAPGGSDDSPPQ